MKQLVNQPSRNVAFVVRRDSVQSVFDVLNDSLGVVGTYSFCQLAKGTARVDLDNWRFDGYVLEEAADKFIADIGKATASSAPYTDEEMAAFEENNPKWFGSLFMER